MKELKKIATAMKERMTWTKELSPDLPSEIIIAKVLTWLLESGMKINKQNIVQLIDEIAPVRKDYYALLIVDDSGYWEIETISDNKQIIDDLYAQKVGEILIERGTIITEKKDNHVIFDNGMEVWKLNSKGNICNSKYVYVVYGDLQEFKIDSILCTRSKAEERMNEIVEEHQNKGYEVVFKDNTGCVFDNYDSYKILHIEMLYSNIES